MKPAKPRRLESETELSEQQVVAWYLVMAYGHPRQSMLRPEHFRHGRHRSWWAAALASRDGVAAFDLGMNSEDVLRLSSVPIPSPPQLERLEHRIVEAWARRHFYASVGSLLDDAKAGKIDVFEAISGVKQVCAQSEAGSLSPVTTLQEAGVELLDRYFAVVRDGRPRPSVPMPLPRLQESIGGWMQGKLWVIGACTSTHKTTLATLAAEHAARSGYQALVWMLEDDQATVASRVLARHVDWLDTRALVMGERECSAGPIEIAALVHESGKVLDSPWAQRLRILAEKQPKLGHVEAVISAEAARGTKLVVLDYLQLIRPDRRVEDWRQHWDDVCHALQALAAELEISIIVTAQPTQSAQREQFQHGRPITVSDLRGGAAISQSAWGIFLLNACGDEHRDEQRRTVWTRDPTAIRISTAKNKAGPRAGGRFRVEPQNDLIIDEEPRA